MPNVKIYKCGDCGDATRKSQGSIQCRLCKLWFHLHCAKVTDKHLALHKEIHDSFFFICKTCLESSSLDLIYHEEDKGFKKYFDELATTLRDDNKAFKTSLMQILSDFKNEISSCINEMRSDIVNCRNMVERVDSDTSSKITELESEVSALHRRIYRGDIVVYGLPSGLNNISSVAICLGKHYNIDISVYDLNLVCYMNGMKQLLIKFNNIDVRDKIMKEYFKTRALTVKDILGGDIVNRVYLNDHFSPATSKLNAICRKMLRLKVISKFKLTNKDKPKAIIMLNDGKQLEWDLKECDKYLVDNSKT